MITEEYKSEYDINQEKARKLWILSSRDCENCGTPFTQDIGMIGLPKGRFCPDCEKNRERLRL